MSVLGHFWGFIPLLTLEHELFRNFGSKCVKRCSLKTFMTFITSWTVKSSFTSVLWSHLNLFLWTSLNFIYYAACYLDLNNFLRKNFYFIHLLTISNLLNSFSHTWNCRSTFWTIHSGISFVSLMAKQKNIFDDISKMVCKSVQARVENYSSILLLSSSTN